METLLECYLFYTKNCPNKAGVAEAQLKKIIRKHPLPAMDWSLQARKEEGREIKEDLGTVREVAQNHVCLRSVAEFLCSTRNPKA